MSWLYKHIQSSLNRCLSVTEATKNIFFFLKPHFLPRKWCMLREEVVFLFSPYQHTCKVFSELPNSKSPSYGTSKLLLTTGHIFTEVIKKKKIYFPKIITSIISLMCCLLYQTSLLQCASHSMYSKGPGCIPWDYFVNIFCKIHQLLVSQL